MNLKDELCTAFCNDISVREDALKAIHSTFDSIGRVDEDASVDRSLSEFLADAIVRVPGAPPLAVFLAISDAKIYEAVLLRTMAKYEKRLDCYVAALLED